MITNICYVSFEIAESRAQGIHVLLIEISGLNTPMKLEGTYGGNQHSGRGMDTCSTTFNINKFLGTQVSTEACLCHDIISEPQTTPCGDNAVAAMGNIGEGASMNKRRSSLKGLNQIRGQGVFQDCRQGALRLQIAGTDWLLVTGIGDDDFADALLEIIEVLRQAKDRHDL